MIVLALMLAQVTTDCQTAGQTTRCTTQAPPQNVGAQILQNMADRQRDEQAQQAAAANGSAERRAAAYAQVGALIARGDCEAAKRLAHFYNHDDIIRDTARACP